MDLPSSYWGRFYTKPWDSCCLRLSKSCMNRRFFITSKPYLTRLLPLRVKGDTGAYLSRHWVRGRIHSGQAAKPLQGTHTHTPFPHTLMPMGNLDPQGVLVFVFALIADPRNQAWTFYRVVNCFHWSIKCCLTIKTSTPCDSPGPGLRNTDLVSPISLTYLFIFILEASHVE